MPRLGFLSDSDLYVCCNIYFNTHPVAHKPILHTAGCEQARFVSLCAALKAQIVQPGRLGNVWSQNSFPGTMSTMAYLSSTVFSGDGLKQAIRAQKEIIIAT